MELYQLLLTSLLPFCVLSFKEPEQYLKFYNTDCKFNSKYVDNGTCNLKVLGRNLIRANVEYDLVTPMKNVTAFIKGYKFYNQFRPFLVNEVINLCKITNKDGFESHNFFAKFFIRILRKVSNVFLCHHKVAILYVFDF